MVLFHLGAKFLINFVLYLIPILRFYTILFSCYPNLNIFHTFNTSSNTIFKNFLQFSPSLNVIATI